MHQPSGTNAHHSSTVMLLWTLIKAKIHISALTCNYMHVCVSIHVCRVWRYKMPAAILLKLSQILHGSSILSQNMYICFVFIHHSKSRFFTAASSTTT